MPREWRKDEDGDPREAKAMLLEAWLIGLGMAATTVFVLSLLFSGR